MTYEPEPLDCPVCGGSGQLLVSLDEPSIRCKRCRGTGTEDLTQEEEDTVESITPVRVYQLGEEGWWHPVSDSGKVYTNMRYDAAHVLSVKPGVRVSIWAPEDLSLLRQLLRKTDDPSEPEGSG